MSLHPDWLTPDWPAPPGVRAVCTTRAGGISQPPFDTFNLGDHVGDHRDAVGHNRALLADALDAWPRFVRQVHATTSVRLHASARNDPAPCADASWTDAPGVACVMLVADCVPVLLTTGDGCRVAAAHAGWRGLSAGVLEQSLQSFVPPALAGKSLQATDVIAWIGPCIGQAAFEVGDEVRTAFVQHDPAAASCFQAAPDRPAAERKWLADLAALCRQRLQAAGITRVHGNDGSGAWCTFSNPSQFFSHRRDAARLGSSGRFAACIWRERC